MATPARTAAFFDLDKTIIAKSSVLAFGRPFYQGGLINRRAVLRSAYAQFVFALAGADSDQIERMRAYLTSMCTGWDVAQVREIVSETLHEIIDPIVYDEAVDLIAMHKAAGRDVVIVSTSGEEVVAPIGAMLGADEVVATRMVVADGKYTGEIEPLRLRPGEGGRDPRAGRGARLRPRRQLRLLRLGHRRADARERSATRTPSTPTARCARSPPSASWPLLTFSNAVPLRERHRRPAARAPGHRRRRWSARASPRPASSGTPPRRPRTTPAPRRGRPLTRAGSPGHAERPLRDAASHGRPMSATDGERRWRSSPQRTASRTDERAPTRRSHHAQVSRRGTAAAPLRTASDIPTGHAW